MIRYKVVDHNEGSVALSPSCSFYTKYKKGAIMEDTKGMGYFLFKTREDAENFIENMLFGVDDAIIKKVETLGEEVKPKKISHVRTMRMLCFYGLCFGPILVITKIPKGTICCKKIKVLD